MRHLDSFILVLSDSCFLNFWNHPWLSSKTWVLLERRCHTSCMANTGVGAHPAYLVGQIGASVVASCSKSFVLLWAVGTCCYQQSKYWNQSAFRVIGSFCSGHLLPEHTAPIVPPSQRALGSLFEPAVASWLFSCMHFTSGGANFCLVLLVLLIGIGNMCGWFLQTCFRRVSVETLWKDHLVKAEAGDLDPHLCLAGCVASGKTHDLSGQQCPL